MRVSHQSNPILRKVVEWLQWRGVLPNKWYKCQKDAPGVDWQGLTVEQRREAGANPRDLI
jgi:hypothetical protein